MAERRVVLQGSDTTAYLMWAYRAPAITHPDYFALTLFNAAFAGGSSLGMGGGSNKSSRLYKALVMSDMAVSAYGGLSPTIDPYLYTINVVVKAGRSLPDVEAMLEAEVARLNEVPLTQSERDKALKRAKVELAMASESITGQAHMLGMAEVVAGDYRWFETVLTKLNEVTQTDIERVRRRYLVPENRTVGWYEPK